MKKIKHKVNKAAVSPVKFLLQITKLNLRHFELLFAATILVATGLVSNKGAVEWVGVVGVLLTFEYTIIANYLGELYGEKTKEKKKKKSSPDEDYHQKLLVFYYLKESIWLVYFLLLGAWSALVGVILFIGYAVWRKAWKNYHEVENLDYL